LFSLLVETIVQGHKLKDSQHHGINGWVTWLDLFWALRHLVPVPMATTWQSSGFSQGAVITKPEKPVMVHVDRAWQLQACHCEYLLEQCVRESAACQSLEAA